MKLTKSVFESLKGFLSEHIPMVRKGDIYGIYNRWVCATHTIIEDEDDAKRLLRCIETYKDNLNDE